MQGLRGEREREREWNIQRSFPWQPLPREIADPRALQNKRGTDCRSHMAPAILSGLIWLDLCVINCAGKLVYTAAYLIKRLYNNGRVYGDSMKWPIKSSWRQMNVLSIGGEQERPRSMWYPDEQGRFTGEMVAVQIRVSVQIANIRHLTYSNGLIRLN